MNPLPALSRHTAESGQSISRFFTQGFVAGVLACLLTPLASAQTFTSLLSFTGSNGASPFMAVLTQGVDGNLYGTSSAGGAHGKGTIFKITPSGKLTTIYSFCSLSGCSDGATPYGGLLLASDGNFYGTTFAGGTRNGGTVYKITPAGKLTTLHKFTFGSDGAEPYDALIQANDGNFYGTAQFGGAHQLGVVFKITPQGTLTTLHSFNGNDGSEPEAGVIQGSDGNLYGTTYNGGLSGGYGAAFKMTLSGTFTTLHLFNDQTDGRQIVSGLVESSDGNFYGTASGGGTSNDGTLFRITPSGAFNVLHNFDGTDGIAPNLLLLGSDGNLYGTAINGGSGNGTVFEASYSGTIATLHSFNNTDGALPFAGPGQYTDGSLYGATLYGGSRKVGTVYKLAGGLPAFVKVVPAFGKVTASVKILGTNLTGATSVTFNGTPATFTVVSANEITVSVPAGATSGSIVVTTPGGMLSSNGAFQILP
jgi:uncharacterized repeat protein (TIGR03803 family)